MTCIKQSVGIIIVQIYTFKASASFFKASEWSLVVSVLSMSHVGQCLVGKLCYWVTGDPRFRDASRVAQVEVVGTDDGTFMPSAPRL